MAKTHFCFCVVCNFERDLSGLGLQYAPLSINILTHIYCQTKCQTLSVDINIATYQRIFIQTLSEDIKQNRNF